MFARVPIGHPAIEAGEPVFLTGDSDVDGVPFVRSAIREPESTIDRLQRAGVRVEHVESPPGPGPRIE